MKEQDSQAPQAPRSGAAAEGSQSPDPFPIHTEDGYCRKAPPPVAEGRQSPGLEERLALLADFIDGARAKLQGVTDGPQLTIGNCDNAAIHLAEIRRALASPSAPQGGGESEDLKAAKVVILDLCSRLERNMDKHPFRDKGEDDRVYQNACAWLAGAAEFMKPATPSQEEGPAGVDPKARAVMEKMRGMLSEQCQEYCGEAANRGVHVDGCRDMQSDLDTLDLALRAQAPASPPRDLEGGRIPQRNMRCPRGHSDVRYTYASDTHGTIWCEECGARHEMTFDGGHIGNALYRAWRTAHPPEDTPAPGTPIEKAAREALAEAERVDTANIVDDYQRGFAVGKVAGLRASLSGLPQESKAAKVQAWDAEHEYGPLGAQEGAAGEGGAG